MIGAFFLHLRLFSAVIMGRFMGDLLVSSAAFFSS